MDKYLMEVVDGGEKKKKKAAVWKGKKLDQSEESEEEEPDSGWSPTKNKNKKWGSIWKKSPEKKKGKNEWIDKIEELNKDNNYNWL